MQKNMKTEQLSDILPLHLQKKPFAIGGLLKKNWENKLNVQIEDNAKWAKLEDDIFKWIQGHCQNGIGINIKTIEIHCELVLHVT